MQLRSLTAADALRAVAIVFAVLIALRFLWFAHAIFMIAFLGVLFGLGLSRATDWLEEHRVRRAIGAPATLLFFLGILAGIGALIANPIRDQSRELSQQLPRALDSIDRWLTNSPAKALGVDLPTTTQQQPRKEPQQQQPRKEPQKDPRQPSNPATQQPEGGGTQQQQGGALRSTLGRELRGVTKFLFPVVSSTFGAIGGLLIVLVIAMYIAVDPRVYREGLLHLVPQGEQERMREVLKTLAVTLRQWLIARLLAMVAIGTITGLGLFALRIKGAIALGVLAGILEFIPFFGPIISAIPAIGIAMIDSPSKALWVAGLYLLVQQLEGNVITPLILKKRLDIPPALTVVTVAAMGVVFGVLGMLIAEPLLATVLVTTKMLYVQDVVGDEVKVGKNDG